MTSIGAQLARYRGVGPGFDFLRVALAISIVSFHAQLLTGNDWIRDTPAWFMEYGLVPMFFALSGFLVTASGMRLSLKNFLINRGLRIVPALAVDIFIAALIIGPLVTRATLGEYFSDPRFFSYFLNATGYIHYQLPGVFETHINTRVNGALWTVPYEIICYAITSFFIVAAFLKSARKVIFFTAAMLLAGMFFELPGVIAMLPPLANKFFFFSLVSRNAQIVEAFLFGMIIFQLRDIIPYSKALMALSVSACLVVALTRGPDLLNQVGPRVVLLPALAYITIFMGLTPIPVPNFFHRGDYSYGIYLYHDPLLQVVINIFPTLAMAKYFGGVFTFFVGLPLVLALACFSWHLIEKPILGLRRRFSFVAKIRGVGNTTTEVPRPDEGVITLSTAASPSTLDHRTEVPAGD